MSGRLDTPPQALLGGFAGLTLDRRTKRAPA